MPDLLVESIGNAAEQSTQVDFVEYYLHYFESVADAREYWKLLNPR